MRTIPLLAASLALIAAGSSCAGPRTDSDRGSICGALAHNWEELQHDSAKHFLGVDTGDPYRGGSGNALTRARGDFRRIFFNTGAPGSRRFATSRDYGSPGVGISFLEWAFNYDAEDPLVD